MDAAAGLAYCMGNEDPYRRSLEGFRQNEAVFIADVSAAVAAQRSGDALRRRRCMRHWARVTRGVETSIAREALDRVLGEIELISPRG